MAQAAARQSRSQVTGFPHPEQEDPVEKRSLALGAWVSLAMAAMGFCAYVLSGSEAVLLDGLYSGVMALTSLVAAHIGANVMRPPDRKWPFGYEGQEAVYVLLRSLLLIGILSYAALSSFGEVLAWLHGRSPEAINPGPVSWYGLLGGLSCGGLAWVQHLGWVRGGRRSDLLRTESRAALVDTAITVSTGAILGATPLLKATPLAPLVPVSDSLLVLLLSLLVIREPIHRFCLSLRETARAACRPELIQCTRSLVEELIEPSSARLLDFSMVKFGRFTYVVAYVNPCAPVDGRWLDHLRDHLHGVCARQLGPVRSEVVLTSRPPFSLATS